MSDKPLASSSKDVHPFSSSLIMQVERVSLAASIGSAYLLQDISFQVNRGDRLVIIGPSGAGKTSLLRLLNRLSTPTSGSIELENHSINEIPIIGLRRQVVLVPQEAKLLGMRVEEALAYPLILQKLPKGEIRQRVETWRTALGIPEQWLERNELQLSLGQRQLVVIARALIMQPKVLLLDEPTSALDLGSINHLHNILKQLTENSHLTIVMVNHQLELVRHFANRILYLEAGKLQEDRTTTELNWQQIQEKLLQAKAKEAQEWL
ncbi:ATP-binding cassette domain-containing protein [Pleurocapsales cyanobacterium LEGE 06147]|nr:ATP-binding cassette domain-containing protein [Pleurocapsales cyanobacterium LEGE 06147]